MKKAGSLPNHAAQTPLTTRLGGPNVPVVKFTRKHVKWRDFYTLICNEMNWIHGNEYTIPALFQQFPEGQIITFLLSDVDEKSPIWGVKLNSFMGETVRNT